MLVLNCVTAQTIIGTSITIGLCYIIDPLFKHRKESSFACSFVPLHLGILGTRLSRSQIENSGTETRNETTPAGFN